MQAEEHFTGAERRSRQISDAEVKFIAEAAAERAISHLFEIFGVDVTTKDGRKGVQDDFTWVREARLGSANLKRAGWRAALGAIITGAIFALWKGIAILGVVMAKAAP